MDNKQYVICEKDDLIAVADALRAKSGSSDTLRVEELPTVVQRLEGGGLNTSDATAVAEDILLDKTAYANGKKITGTFSIDEEIAEQEEKIASQDGLIADIVAALEGKAAGGNNEVSMVTIHLGEEADGWAGTLTIPELIGAKYFIIQGNPLNAAQINNTNYTDDAGNIYQIIYLNGLVYMSYLELLSQKNNCSITNKIINDTDVFSFDEITGTINVGTTGFCKISTDTSTTDVIYTVYRIG